MKKLIMLDMDDTIADFGASPEFDHIERLTNKDVSAMFEPGFFLSLQPVPGSLSAVRHLIRLGFEVQLLTQPVAESPHCYAEKVKWIGIWFPELIGKINMVQDKGLIKADFLIDDNSEKWQDKFEANGGTFVVFHYKRNDPDHNRKYWKRVLTFFEAQVKKAEQESAR